MCSKLRRTAVVAVTAGSLLTLAACGSDDPVDSVEDAAKEVAQELHDDTVAAYDETEQFLVDLEDDVTDVTRGAYDSAVADFRALESELDAAVDKTGEEATRAYREIQHDLESFARSANDVLHEFVDDVEDAEKQAWAGLQDGYHSVANSIDHVIDSLF